MQSKVVYRCFKETQGLPNKQQLQGNTPLLTVNPWAGPGSYGGDPPTDEDGQIEEEGTGTHHTCRYVNYTEQAELDRGHKCQKEALPLMTQWERGSPLFLLPVQMFLPRVHPPQPWLAIVALPSWLGWFFFSLQSEWIYVIYATWPHFAPLCCRIDWFKPILCWVCAEYLA